MKTLVEFIQEQLLSEKKDLEHVICQDAAGNWRIKGHPGKGTNTDKLGFWKAKYETKEKAEAALRGYFAHVNENFVKGVFKKGDDVIILWTDCNPVSADNKDINIEKEEPSKIEKVVSKDLGRYRGDQHTWVYVNGYRFELYDGFNEIFKGYLDSNYKKNPDKYAIIVTPEQLANIKADKGSIFKF